MSNIKLLGMLFSLFFSHVYALNTSSILAFKGSVKNSFGIPLINATVSVVNVNQFNNGYYISFPNFPSDRKIQTDTIGNYKFYDIQPGNYFVVAQMENKNYIPTFYPSSYSPFGADTIKVGTTTTSATINFTLNPGEIIRGFIVDKNGNGLGGLRANLNSDVNNNSNAINISYEAKSDIYGKFEFLGIPSGSFRGHVWSENSFYTSYGYNNEVINSDASGISEFTKPFVMQKSGYLHGTISGIVINSNNNNMNLGRLFPLLENFIVYPQFDTTYVNSKQDSGNYVPSVAEEAIYKYIGVKSDSGNNNYKTDAIPIANMKFVFSPEPQIDFNNFINSSINIKPSYRWSFFDNATSLATSQLFSITENIATQNNFSVQTGGYTILGNIVAEIPDTSSYKDNYSNGNYKNIMAFVKENGVLIKVAESNNIENNKFILSGLVEGESYYLFINANQYPRQWWADSANFSTANPYKAKPFIFAANSYTPVTLYLNNHPGDENNLGNNNNHIKVSIKNQTMSTIGLKTIKITWSPLPATDNIVKYKIFRFKDTSATTLKNLFTLTNYGYEPNKNVNLDSLSDSTIVVDTLYIDTDVKYGVQYMYVIIPIDKYGREGEALPADISLNNYITTINFSNFVKNHTVTTNSWQMVGIPGVESHQLKNPTDTSSELALYYWDENADSTGLYSKYVKSTTINPTEGYWIYSSNIITQTISDSSIGKLYGKFNSISVKLDTGWNQISSPFPYSISPSFITATSPAYEYDNNAGGYKMVEKELEPWKGYWFHSGKKITYNLSGKPSSTVKRKRSRFARSKLWEIKLSISGKKNCDIDNYIGLISANGSRENIATMEPPVAFGAPSLYISENSQKYSKCYKPSSQITKNEWKIALSPSNENMVLDISQIGSVPENIQLFWINRGAVQDIRSNSSIEIPAHSETIYGYLAAVEDQSAIAFYTGQFSLRQNYPNPFRGVTTFEFVLPHSYSAIGEKISSDEQNVSLNIYNMNGRKVSTVFNKNLKVGIHKEIWRSAGLSAGVYIARIKGLNFIKSIKLLKLK